MVGRRHFLTGAMALGLVAYRGRLFAMGGEAFTLADDLFSHANVSHRGAFPAGCCFPDIYFPAVILFGADAPAGPASA